MLVLNVCRCRDIYAKISVLSVLNEVSGPQLEYFSNFLSNANLHTVLSINNRDCLTKSLSVSTTTLQFSCLIVTNSIL